MEAELDIGCKNSKAECIHDAKRTLKLVVFTTPIWGICALLGYGPIGFNLWCLAVLLGLIIQVRQELRAYRWFWVLLADIGIVHLPIVLWAPWNGKRFMGAAAKPVSFADFIFIYFIVYLSEKVFLKKTSSSGEKPPDRPPSLLD